MGDFFSLNLNVKSAIVVTGLYVIYLSTACEKNHLEILVILDKIDISLADSDLLLFLHLKNLLCYVLFVYWVYFLPLLQQQFPKPCCAKHQLTADLQQITGSYTNGTPSTVETLMKIQYDYDTLMIKLELSDGTTIIQDFNQTKQYTTSGKSCRTDDIQSDIQLQPPCVPSNAVYRGRNTIGDDVTYDVDTWFVAGTPWGNITVSVMAHDCTISDARNQLNANNGWAAATPKLCCSKHQLTADLHQVTGSYFNGTPSTLEKKQYTLSGKSCSKNDLPNGINMQPPCIQSNAIYRGRNTIGDDVAYDVDTWFIESSSWGNLTVSVMAHDCTLVVQGISANANNG
ncbi:unnamed protein product [Mytilus coruscus]|uniref:Uncharacterized protein n=1 Tax=Mytilus coruscus TaxID=42192 RepID=A0A6J8EHS3_MYTCO|nr:unnamed protein product [Mytilus coruscus]